MTLPVFEPRALFEARVSRGLSRVALAERSKVSKETIRRAENGTFVPRPENLVALANALEIATLDLFAEQVTA